MEGSTPSKRAAAFGRYDDQVSVRHCIGVDEKWGHQRVCEETCQCESVGARTSLPKILILPFH